MRRLVSICAVVVIMLALVVAGATPGFASESTIYVATTGDDVTGDGSPGNPYRTIQKGISMASSGDTVSVASGTYFQNITLKDGVVVQGAGADVTIIDGITGSVVTAIGVGSDTALDGFTITGGNAANGGGMLNSNSSPTVTNCIFYNNSAWDGGGGMFNDQSSPIVTNCIFSSNSAGWGGGMFNGTSPPMVTDCTFSGNSAVNGGGGMYNYDHSSPTVTNCIFSGNLAMWGGGVNNDESSPTVANCTFSSNSATAGGGGMSNGGASPTVTNCILWDNGGEIYSDATSTPMVTYCDIQGGYAGDSNIDADPMFVDPAGGDYHLRPDSPCIDMGSNAAVPGWLTTDFEGDTRILDGDGDGQAIVDMGADEYCVSATIDVDPDTLNLKSKGKFVTVHIELPTGYDVEDIDVSTVMLNDTVNAEPKPTEIADYDSNGVPKLMVKFDRAAVQETLEVGDEVEITITGEVNGILFKGSDTIRVIGE